jgi:hypothetical protein
VRTNPHLLVLSFLMTLIHSVSPGGGPERLSEYRTVARRLLEAGLRDGEAYAMLQELTARAPHRLSGSPGADSAISVTKGMMESKGFDRVRLEPVMVPHWVRGPVEKAEILIPGRSPIPLAVCALGGSVATPKEGITAEVVEVKSFDELRALGAGARGKIIFFNRPMDPAKLNTFEAYGGAVDQRGRGAVESAEAGGVAALVRSVTLSSDNVPHTGAMGYREGSPQVPAAAVSVRGANQLSDLLQKGNRVRLRITLRCATLPEVPSANVMGEIRGFEKPDEVIVVGGHLDSWDTGTGAHDDGAGCVQAIDVLSLIRRLNLAPKRTIRAVMFMNEENGLRGGKAYAVAPERGSEKHIAMVESDRGGFAPRGITVQADSLMLQKVRLWGSLFEELNAGRIEKGGSGADVSAMVGKGVPGFGLDVENHRYFDYHHSANDAIDKVNPRELEMGAVVMALLCYLLAQEGVD